MFENDELLTSIQRYREMVLQYEAAHAEINQLIEANHGGTENMSESDVARYRQLARHRDELFSEMRWLEQQLSGRQYAVTYPEAVVLVGVLNRKRDFIHARDDHWYRIPEKRMPNGVHVQYLAFFQSRAFKERNGGIYYFAPVRGVELAYRRWLLPGEPDHPRADERYYKIALGDLQEKEPPIRNTDNRVITFIYTTWDRFFYAHKVSELYSEADYFVDRVYYALRHRGITVERVWDAQRRSIPYAPGLRVLCQDGSVYASFQTSADALLLDLDSEHDQVVKKIRTEIERRGGPADVSTPLEGH